MRLLHVTEVTQELEPLARVDLGVETNFENLGDLGPVHPSKVDRLEHLGGRSTVLWEGEPRSATEPRWFVPPLAETNASIRTVRLTLNTDAVAGWNEIDAVELIGDGQNQWATGARSSSCYAHR